MEKNESIYRDPETRYNNQLDEIYSDIYYAKGILVDLIGKKEEALGNFNEAIHRNPKDSGAYYKKGLLLEELGKKEEAFECYNKATDALHKKGILLEDIGIQALKCYNKAIQINPNFVLGYCNRGLLRQKYFQDNDEMAISDYKKAQSVSKQEFTYESTLYRNHIRQTLTKLIDLEEKYLNTKTKIENLQDDTSKKIFRDRLITIQQEKRKLLNQPFELKNTKEKSLIIKSIDEKFNLILEELEKLKGNRENVEDVSFQNQPNGDVAFSASLEQLQEGNKKRNRKEPTIDKKSCSFCMF